MTPLRSHYDVLGLSKTDDAATLRKAFCSLSKSLHPDTTSLPPDEAANRFFQVCEAYEILSDPMRRMAYDQALDEVNMSETAHCDKSLILTKNFSSKSKIMEVRRALSGGELLSLLLLALALLISLFLALGFALAQGRELQARPSWLIVQSQRNVPIASSSNTTQSTFFNSVGILAQSTWS